MEYIFDVYRILKAKNIDTKKVVDGDIVYDETSGNFGDIEHFLVTVQIQDQYKSLDTFTTTKTHYIFPHECSKEDELAGLVIEYKMKHPFNDIDGDDVFTYAGCSVSFRELIESIAGPFCKTKIKL